MLSRTAENLFWITRYMERAETIARLLEVGSRNALMPSVSGGFRNEWESILQASGTAAGFREKYGDVVQRNIESYLFFDLDNPSSIASCISLARENGRIVRTALTSQVWDALNGAFQEMQEMRRTERSKLVDQRPDRLDDPRLFDAARLDRGDAAAHRRLQLPASGLRAGTR